MCDHAGIVLTEERQANIIIICVPLMEKKDLLSQGVTVCFAVRLNTHSPQNIYF